MTTPEIQAAAEQASENLSLETSAVIAETAAESAVIAADSAIQLAHMQAAIVINDARVEIQEHTETVENLEGSLEWLREQMSNQSITIQSLAQELRTTQEQIALLTLSQIVESTPIPESLSSTPLDLGAVTEVVTAETVPSQSEVVDAPPEVVAEKSQAKKKRLNLL